MFEKEQFYQFLHQFTQEDECCLNCGKAFTDIVSLLFPRRDLLCVFCRQQVAATLKTQQVKHLSVQYLYEYTDDFASYLYRFKGIGDERLYALFLEPVRRKIKKMYRDFIVVRMPSWHEDDDRRGFNHVELMFSGIGKEILCPFVKLSSEKQASKGKEERAKVHQLIQLVEGINVSRLQGEKVLVVDDVMTTGNTLFHAIALLKLTSPSVLVVALHASLSK